MRHWHGCTWASSVQGLHLVKESSGFCFRKSSWKTSLVFGLSSMSGLSTSGNIQSSSVKSSASGRETSLQTPPGYQDMQPVASRHVSLRDMVLTPARVPPFIIPTLSAARRSGRCSAGASSRRHTLPGSAHSPRPNRAPSRCCCPLSALEVSGMESRACALSDPWTRAAMSLPHLAKITTPYGFLTLGESPCVRRRESLFFQEHQPQPGPSQGQQVGL